MPWCKHEVARTSLSYLPVVLVLVMMNTIMMMKMSKGSNDHDDGDEHQCHDDDSRGSLAMDQAMGVGA